MPQLSTCNSISLRSVFSLWLGSGKTSFALPSLTASIPLSTPRPGARLYHSSLSLWLSVDPLSDKYPGVSPYAYCGNNPVRLVDVDGREMTEWDLLRDGTLKLRENGRTDVDIVYATSDDGQSISRQFKANTISQQSKMYRGISEDGKPFTTEYRSFSDHNAAIDFFEFAADNTDNEWAISGGRGKAIVGTSKQGSVSMPSIKNELFFCHSHKTNGDNELATLSGSDYSGWEFHSQKGSLYYVYITSSQTFYEYKKPASFIVNGVTKYQHSSDNWFTSKGPRISPHY